tara:strand:- start:89 stop:277 length:189 start_codon:yes stop_codon:yes gene_type:complete
MGFFIAGAVVLYFWFLYQETEFTPYAVPMILATLVGMWFSLGKRITLGIIAVGVFIKLLQWA